MSPSTVARVGIGPTSVLSLRVSVAVLARVLFKDPVGGDWMLGLERKATLLETEQGPVVEVRVQPFGGAVRIRDLAAMEGLVRDFHFDSAASQYESDFRLFIRPSSWPGLRKGVLASFSRAADALLDSDPARELQEEFCDALELGLTPGQYTSQPVGALLEERPLPTQSTRARGYPTVRIYRVYAVTIRDPGIAQAMLTSSARITDQDLRALALADKRAGGKGRANAVLTLPLKTLTDYYQGLPLDARNQALVFKGHSLEPTVPAVLAGVVVPQYVRM